VRISEEEDKDFLPSLFGVHCYFNIANFGFADLSVLPSTLPGIFLFVLLASDSDNGYTALLTFPPLPTSQSISVRLLRFLCRHLLSSTALCLSEALRSAPGVR
jgi:hypothetical protein